MLVQFFTFLINSVFRVHRRSQGVQ